MHTIGKVEEIEYVSKHRFSQCSQVRLVSPCISKSKLLCGGAELQCTSHYSAKTEHYPSEYGWTIINCECHVLTKAKQGFSVENWKVQSFDQEDMNPHSSSSLRRLLVLELSPWCGNVRLSLSYLCGMWALESGTCSKWWVHDTCLLLEVQLKRDVCVCVWT